MLKPDLTYLLDSPVWYIKGNAHIKPMRVNLTLRGNRKNQLKAMLLEVLYPQHITKVGRYTYISPEAAKLPDEWYAEKMARMFRALK